MGLWEKIEISKKRSVRRKKMNRPKADSSAQQRLSPSEPRPARQEAPRHGPASSLLPAAPRLRRKMGSLSLTHRGHLAPRHRLQKCRFHRTPASTTRSQVLVFANVRQAMGCPVVRVGKGLITGAINVLSAQKTEWNVSSFAKCALFRHSSSFGVKPIYSSTARLSPPLARNSGQRARLFSVCLSSARSPSEVALNKHQAGQTGWDRGKELSDHKSILRVDKGRGYDTREKNT